MNFITEIATGKVSPETHNVFVRFSTGTFEREEFTLKVQKDKIKMAAGLDLVNPFQRFLAQHSSGDATLEGGIPTTRDVGSILKKYGISAEQKIRHGKSGKKYEFSTTLLAAQLQKFVEDLYDFYLLFDVRTESGKLLVKKETPKIGSLKKRFVQLEVSSALLKKVVDEFLFDANVSSFKSAKIAHTVIIDAVVVDEKLLKTDALRARLEAKRKGTLKRIITVDGTTIEKEYAFEV